MRQGVRLLLRKPNWPGVWLSVWTQNKYYYNGIYLTHNIVVQYYYSRYEVLIVMSRACDLQSQTLIKNKFTKFYSRYWEYYNIQHTARDKADFTVQQSGIL